MLDKPPRFSGGFCELARSERELVAPFGARVYFSKTSSLAI